MIPLVATVVKREEVVHVVLLLLESVISEIMSTRYFFFCVGISGLRIFDRYHDERQNECVFGFRSQDVRGETTVLRPSCAFVHSCRAFRLMFVYPSYLQSYHPEFNIDAYGDHLLDALRNNHPVKSPEETSKPGGAPKSVEVRTQFISQLNATRLIFNKSYSLRSVTCVGSIWRVWD